MDVISSIPVIEISELSQNFAEHLIDERVVPEEYKEDALHIALACLNGMDFLLTWNFKHLNNAFIKTSIVRAIEKQGFEAPEICSQKNC